MTTTTTVAPVLQPVVAASVAIGVVLSALDEAGDAGAPIGILYAALMGKVDFNGFQSLIATTLRHNLIETANGRPYSHGGNPVVRVTAKGREWVDARRDLFARLGLPV